MAWRSANQFLGRYGDVFTKNDRDDLAQEAALAALQQAPGVRDRERFPALVRTISRRMRGRSIHTALRRVPPGGAMCELFEPDPAAPPALLVCGSAVPLPWLTARLDAALGSVTALNRALLLGYHEGFCCAELAARYRLTEQSVKVRLHRARRRVRQRIEAEVRAAGRLAIA